MFMISNVGQREVHSGKIPGFIFGLPPSNGYHMGIEADSSTQNPIVPEKNNPASEKASN